MKSGKIHPYMIIIFSFLSVILIGTILLVMPFASTTGKSIGFVDSLFMATSSVCVTGLSVVTVSADLTVYGKIVMMLLMEIGGLSFITIAVFFFTVIGAKIGVSNRILLRESLNQSSLNGIVPLVRKIIFISFTIQILCAFINLISFTKYYDNFWEALGVSLFHSCASFNNAGFDIIGDESLIPFKSDILLNITTISMILLGGIGFVVIDDVVRNKRWSRFKLHSKLVLVTTVILFVCGGLLIKLTNWDDMTFMQSFFTSATCRTAGFATYDMSQLRDHPATYVIIVMLMVIGASPCSTGGGVKTTTFAVVMISIFYFARGKKAKAFKRRISDGQLFKAFVLVAVALAIIVVGTFLVLVIQPEFKLDEVLFEVASGFSTTGLSMGITKALNPANRIIMCFIMLLGRLGPLTVIGIVNKNWMTSSKEQIQYVEESVVIG